MYSSCALLQRLAGRSRQLDDAERHEHFGGAGADDARLIDQPRQHRAQRALAIADRAERLQRRGAHDRFRIVGGADQRVDDRRE